MGRLAEAALRRQRSVTLAGLVILAGLAWVWLLLGAGMQDMPGMAMPVAGDATRFLLTLSMWWVMMVAMMVPAAAPVVLLYSHAASRQKGAPPNSAAFVAGYLLTWLVFSLVATTLQMALEQAMLAEAMAMRLSSPAFRGGVLVAAGIYQLSPWKDSCLSNCRSPAQFLTRHYRPGGTGALAMGVVHGAYCVGCCWLLMALLLVGGVMNLLWIVGLTLLVALEKLHPRGHQIAKVMGGLCIAAGLTMLILR